MSGPIHIISLGAGVQSSTMALMAAHGVISPMPVAAIFADTQAEPKSVYTWLDCLEKQLPFPVYRVSYGNLFSLSTVVHNGRNGKRHTRHSVPAFLEQGGKRSGIAMRQCTRDFKIRPVVKQMGRIRRETGKPLPVIQWIGISSDEAHRMKDAREKWLKSRWPLIELMMSRSDCLEWMASHGYPVPPRSSCSFCPYHNDAEWRRLKTDEPEAFDQAVQYEKAFQSAIKQGSGFVGNAFLHRSLKPLDQVVFADFSDNANQFGNECEGMCGV